MSNLDKTSGGLTQRRKAQTLATFHVLYPERKPMINAESLRISEQSGTCIPCSTSCTELGEFSTITGYDLISTGFTIDGISYTDRYTVEWTAVPNATSYTFTFTYSPENNLVVPTGETTAYVYTNNLSSFILTAINSCDSASSEEQSAPCFLAGSLVAMADGTTKAIEDVRVGDMVVGAFGEINAVLALHRPLLGSRRMCRINDEHSTTAHHPHISADRGFYCMDPYTLDEETYGRAHVVLNAEGQEVEQYLHGLQKGRVQQLVEGVALKTLEGSRVVRTVALYDLPADTQLYNLVVAGSHTYHVEGYAVTGWPREDDFNYDAWAPRTHASI
jgi:hypothetical protein